MTDNMTNFAVEVRDTKTNTVCPVTTIDGRMYVAAEHGMEFFVVFKVIDKVLHTKHNPHGNLNAWLSIEGENVGHSLTFFDDTTR